ncbi:acetylglutamate kinase [Pedomonas mirosovicensis]|uniref:acetylglutamate kinase n=1 Tax=Pedomonas mirosovicensis TaxID=2908641 RepID=UPI002166EFF5|nr:acetylglutamate kinase [Pedomonas mirosovicensis]MCH8684213.1 acetylglutamate kinase [Pedomonas mirosovicensis]
MTDNTKNHSPDPVDLEKVETLIEALPYLRKYAGKTFVVKYGGHAMGESHLAAAFAKDIVLLKKVGIHPVVVHGGGPQIGKMLERLGIRSNFIDGLRVTDAETAAIAEMVLAGSINKEVVHHINRAGGTAVGLSGKDANLVTARKVTRTKRDPDSNIERILDLGFVGEPDVVDVSVLDMFRQSNVIPVIAPIGVDAEGNTYNINADTMAGAIAGALKAARLFLLTDVPGVLDKEKNLLTDLTPQKIDGLIADGTIQGGMIPKIETCIDALKKGVDAAVILNGRVPHSMLLEIFTRRGAGTLVRRS